MTFHPSYTYEDFVLGIRPNTDEAEGIKYEKVSGKLKRFVIEHGQIKNNEYAIFIR